MPTISFVREMKFDKEESIRLLDFIEDEKNSEPANLNIVPVKTDSSLHARALRAISEYLGNSDEN